MAGRTAGPFAATPGISTSSATSAKTKSHIISLGVSCFLLIDIFYTYYVFSATKSIHFTDPHATPPPVNLLE
jgi:hypothetical protein